MDLNIISKLYKLSFKRSILKIKENKSALFSTIFIYSIIVGTIVLLFVRLNQDIREALESIIGRNYTHLIINVFLLSLFMADYVAKLFGKSHKGLIVYPFLTQPIKKEVLADAIFIKECFSLWNFALPLFFLPCLLIYPYGIDKIVCYMFFLYTLSTCNTIIARIFRLGRKRNRIYYLYIVLYYLILMLSIPIMLQLSYAVLFKTNIYFYALLGIILLLALHRIFRKTCIQDFYYIDE